jgi:hypothetical protein
MVTRDEIAADARQREIAANTAESEAETQAALAKADRDRQTAEIAQKTKAFYLAISQAERQQAEDFAQKESDRKIALLIEDAKAQTERMKAVNPALVEALVALAQAGQFEKIAQHLAPLSIVRGESLAGTMEQMFAGTALEGMVNNLQNMSKVKSAK